MYLYWHLSDYQRDGNLVSVILKGSVTSITITIHSNTLTKCHYTHGKASNLEFQTEHYDGLQYQTM